MRSAKTCQPSSVRTRLSGVMHLPRPGGPERITWVQRLAALERGRDEHAQVVLDLLLPDELVEGFGAERLFDVGVGRGLRRRGVAGCGVHRVRGWCGARYPAGVTAYVTPRRLGLNASCSRRPRDRRLVRAGAPAHGRALAPGRCGTRAVRPFPPDASASSPLSSRPPSRDLLRPTPGRSRSRPG